MSAEKERRKIDQNSVGARLGADLFPRWNKWTSVGQRFPERVP